MGHRSALCRAGFLLLIPFVLAAVHAQETSVVGPVEKVDQRESSFTVLGQTFAFRPSALVAMGGKMYSFSDVLRIVRPGAYVAVVGIETTSGQLIAQEIQVSRRPYVPGASEVFISGLVTSYDASTGQARVGAQQIDVTPAFATSAYLELSVGSRIEAFGRQASTGGVVWLSDLRVARQIDTGSISGTGNATSLQSISGTGARTGKQSISGTGASTSTQSISGTGARTSVQSISGTGASTSTQSISGTGTRTSVHSISGTGASTSSQSISGTGARTSVQSISGTGASLSIQSISGTGARASVQSISGTGTRTSVQSISGTGIRTLIN
jgi:hypothetical protein